MLKIIRLCTILTKPFLTSSILDKYYRDVAEVSIVISFVMFTNFFVDMYSLKILLMHRGLRRFLALRTALSMYWLNLYIHNLRHIGFVKVDSR